MRKAGIEMPTKDRTASPARPKRVSTPTPTAHARSAIALRSPRPAPRVRATKSGARPIGSTMTKSVTKAVSSSVSMPPL